MATSRILKSALILAATSAVALPAMAGGLERGGYNIDLLFDDSDYAIDSSATFVAPQRKAKNVTGDFANTAAMGGPIAIPGSFANSADDSANFWSKRVGLRARFTESLDCMVDYSEPWGAHLNPGAGWQGAGANIETDVWSRNYAGTCRVKFDLGKGDLSIIGGGFYQEIGGFKERLYFSGTALEVGRLDMEGNGWGWRAGLAYEIPEIAFRTSLVYNSAVDHDLEGSLQTPPFTGRGTIPVYGEISMPDTLELKVQSGIAQDWLAFGSVKWTDWSQLQVVPFCATAGKGVLACAPGTSASLNALNLFYRDGWTISGGVGHKINDQWSVGGTLTWDRGVSTGMSALTDTWTVGAAVTYKPVENIEVRLAGAVGILTSGESVASMACPGNPGVQCGDGATYDFGTDFVAGISTGIKVRF